MDIQNISIETDRLLLLPTIQNHAQDVFDNLDEETKYMTILKTNKIEDTITWIETVLEKRKNQEELQMTFFDKSSKEFIWNIWLHGIKTTTPELGIWIKQSAYGNKFGQEAIWALINRANKNLKFEYLLYNVDKDNIASRKAAEKFWWILDVDSDWKEIISPVKTQDPNKVLSSVLYKIYPNK